MPKRSSNEDANQAAARIMRTATAEEPEDSTEAILEELEQRLAPHQLRQLAAAILGREGGKRGGKARAQKLSAKRRSEIAKKAALARWGDPESR